MPAFEMTSKPPPRSAADVPIADMSHLYDALDPRGYYAALRALDYQTPGHVQKLTQWCCQQRQGANTDEETWVLDVGCGFATNAAGLRHGMPPPDLYARYGDPALANLPPEDLREADRVHFSTQDATPIHIAGLEVAENALNYGREISLLSAGFSEDLTGTAPSADLQAILSRTAVIMESGVPIFIFPYVVDALLSACSPGNRPWIVTAPPRYTDMSIYGDILARHGYVLEQAHPESLPHRRFASETEKRDIIADQAAMGLENSREETEGYILVNLYLARPKSDAGTTDTLTI